MEAHWRPVRSTHHISSRAAYAAVLLLAAGGADTALAGSAVLFDFARVAECRDVTPEERLATYPDERLVEVRLPISVRFHGVPARDVEKIDVDVDGSSAGLRVHGFAPTTELASDTKEIETTTTTNRARSLDATLGGAVPIPAADLVARVTPSVSAGAVRSETATEKTLRLPPKHAVVVSGTAHQGQGVFYTFKPWSQTSLEGVHELRIVFIAPACWTGGSMKVACGARGKWQLLWIEQPKSLGGMTARVDLYLEGDAAMRAAALRRAGFEHACPTSTVAATTAADAVPVAEYPAEVSDEGEAVPAGAEEPADG